MTKISELTAVSSLSSSDTLVVVQGTTTMKATVGQLPSTGSGGTTSTAVIDITQSPYNADKTGATECLPALRSAVSALNALGGGTVKFPAGTYKLTFADQSGGAADSSLTIPASVTLEGVGFGSVLNIGCSVSGGFIFCFKMTGGSPGVRNLKFSRSNNFDGVYICPNTSDNAFIENVEFDGKVGTIATNYVHGLLIGNGTVTNFRWVGGRAHHLTYPLLQSSPSTGTTIGFLVDDVEFYVNTATDLEFNAPHSLMKNITIRNCYAHDQSTSATNGGWFFAGFARVQGGIVHNNTVDTYRGEPLHIEDGSTDIKVYDNTFRSCGVAPGAISYFQVISNSSRVWIHDNFFDASVNTNYVYMIGLQAGGSGTTDGGNPFYPPYEVQVHDNHFAVGTSNGIYIEGNARTKIHSNRFKGTGVWDSGTLSFGGSNAGYGVDPVDGDGVQIIDNDFEGIGFPVRLRTSSSGPGNNTGSRSGVFALNRISVAKVGVGIINPERMKINGNTVSRAEFPYVVGEGSGTANTISFTNNDAQDCKWPINVDGKHTIVAGSSPAVGNGVTLTVAATYVKIPSGIAFTFTNGAVFTTTAAASMGATSLTGNVTTAAIVSGQGGTSVFGSIPHSTTSANNHVLRNSNLDTVAGIYA